MTDELAYFYKSVNQVLKGFTESVKPSQNPQVFYIVQLMLTAKAEELLEDSKKVVVTDAAETSALKSVRLSLIKIKQARPFLLAALKKAMEVQHV